MNVQSQKRLLSIILVIIIVLLPSTVFGSGKVEVPTVVQTDVEIIEPVEITFWYAVSGALGDVIQKMANEFNASQDKITVVAEYSGEYVPALNKLRLAIQSKTAPNIAMTYDAGTRTMVDSNATVSIDTLKAKYPSVQIDFSDYIQSAVNYYSFDGEQFALPFCLSSPILYYNKDRFKEVGLDPDRPPKTYEEFLVAAEKLTDKNSVRAKYGASWAIRSWLVETSVATQNGLFVNQGNGRSGRATEVFLNEDPAVNFISMWAEMAKKGYYISPGRNWNDGRNNFTSGVSAMMLQSTAGLARTLADIGGRFELGTASFPKPAGAEGGVVYGGNGLWVMSGHPAVEEKAALIFLSWLAQPKQQITLSVNTGYYPLTNTAINELKESGYYQENPHFYTALEQALSSKSTPATAGAVIGVHTEVRNIVENGIEEIIATNADVKTVLAKQKAEIDALLAEYNLMFK